MIELLGLNFIPTSIKAQKAKTQIKFAPKRERNEMEGKLLKVERHEELRADEVGG